MLISPKIEAAFNAQIGHELGNAHQYLAIAAYFQKEALFGLTKIYAQQAEEERDHAAKFVKFLLDAGASPRIPAVAEPRNDIASAVDAAQLAYDSEIKTTEQINALVDLALAERNHVAHNFLQWFVAEQLEEVASADDRLRVIRNAGPTVMMVEAYLAHQ